MDFNDLKGMFAEVKTRMDAGIDRVRREMASVRTGRATVSLLDGVQVDAYGSRMPITLSFFSWREDITSLHQFAKFGSAIADSQGASRRIMRP